MIIAIAVVLLIPCALFGAALMGLAWMQAKVDIWKEEQGLTGEL